MSVQIYHEGDLPNNSCGISIQIKNRNYDFCKSKWINFKKKKQLVSKQEQEKLIAKAFKLEQKYRKELQAVKNEMGIIKPSAKSKKYPELETSIKGLFLSFQSKHFKKETGNSYCNYYCMIYSQTNGKPERKLSARTFSEFKTKYIEALKHHIKARKLDASDYDTNSTPIDKKTFTKHIERLKRKFHNDNPSYIKYNGKSYSSHPEKA